MKKVSLLLLAIPILFAGPTHAGDCNRTAGRKAEALQTRVVVPDQRPIPPAFPDIRFYVPPVHPESQIQSPVFPADTRCVSPVMPESPIQRPTFPDMTFYRAPVFPGSPLQRPTFPEDMQVTVVSDGNGNPWHCPTPRGRNR